LNELAKMEKDVFADGRITKSLEPLYELLVLKQKEKEESKTPEKVVKA
jgi:hypothetical protein